MKLRYWVAAALVAGGAAALWIRGQGERPVDTASDALMVRERVRVEVLNAGGVPGAARRATQLLRSRGFDVVFWGNAEAFTEDSSLVYDRVGRMDWAEGVAKALGISNVLSRPDPNLYVDVTVRVGREWEEPGAAADGATGAFVWWNPRTWLRRGGAEDPQEHGTETR